MYCTRKESDILGVDHEELDASEIHAKRLSAKEVILPKEISNSKSQMEQYNFLEEIRH